MKNNIDKLMQSDKQYTNWFNANQGRLNYRSSECEVGKVLLSSPDSLKLVELYIDTAGSPMAKNGGYYVINGMDIIKSCENYNPEGILVWVPVISSYASWDCDHWKLIVFPNVKWVDILKNPERYLNSQWSPDLGGGVYFDSWEVMEYRQGSPF